MISRIFNSFKWSLYFCFRYRNIYTSEGLTLHELALKLQVSLNSNGVSSIDFSDIDDPHNIATSGKMLFIFTE